jgi:hypothetical protein
MKKQYLFIIILIITCFQLSAQRTKDVLNLKNGSLIYGKLVEVNSVQYKIQTSDGSLLVYPVSEVEKFSREAVSFEGRKPNGFSFSLEAGLLVGPQSAQYSAPFSFSFLAGITSNLKNSVCLGSGVEFVGRPYTPLFIEYKYIFQNRKASPFIFARGGAVIPLGSGESSASNNTSTEYDPKNYKGGGSIAIGSGISWANEDMENYLSFAYRYAHSSYEQKEYNRGDVTYSNNLNRLEIKFGFKF